ncbi:hypothetical protein OKW30_001912 [Paraburkholderia sp. Clong3]|nr:hypothetical protein [Paraburkholderia sp. CI2]
MIAVDNSSNPSAANGAVYKGLVFGVNAQGGFLFATNFRSGRIDVFGPNGSDGLFTPATTDGGFADPNIPAGYDPFWYREHRWGSFRHLREAGQTEARRRCSRGRGFVDVFDTDGRLLRRFAS